jgi:aminocarboxymuconate-semialdehyde decarboxylase
MPGGGKPKSTRTRGRARKPVAIDFHAHIVVPEVFAVTQKHGLHARLGLGPVAALGDARRSEEVMRKMSGTTERLADMDAMGVDIQVISPSLVHSSSYWAEGAEAIALDRTTNDALAAMVATNPDRFVGIGIVPMHDPALAVQELERCVTSLGFRGVAISTEVNGAEIGDPKFRPFWKTAEQLGAVVFIHPAGNDNPRLRRFGLSFHVGQPFEEALAMASLVFDRILDDFPKLKVLIVHGGGYLPFYAGRLDQAVRNNLKDERLSGDFSSYVKRLYYDTVLFNPDMLEYLATKAPPRHIVMGSDWPFAEKRPVHYVRRAKKLPQAVQDGIVGANAARLLGITI